ncbi:hypothetical protein VP01_660g2 [Puccinia sorghi]|uniref:Uncharacterized protein n=1 Tax=Puccinia sorghi TaxID=27349 RepID=A0A0L6UHA5_9BASI|nr:hypothetical protein VP01_660g2 [Puccinia sorghi]
MAIKAQLRNGMFIVLWEGGCPIEVIIKLHLFIAGKIKQEKKTCVAKKTNILVDYGLTSFEDFQTRVAMAMPNFLKKDKYCFQSQSDYTTWLQTAADTEKSEVSLTLTMPNPADAAKRQQSDICFWPMKLMSRPQDMQLGSAKIGQEMKTVMIKSALIHPNHPRGFPGMGARLDGKERRCLPYISAQFPSLPDPQRSQKGLTVIPSFLPEKCEIKGYVSFLGIRDKENFVKKLMVNGFHSHKIFKSPVTLLFDNVPPGDHLQHFQSKLATFPKPEIIPENLVRNQRRA